MGVGRTRAERLLALLAERGLTVATGESLTGGLVVASLIRVPGASTVVKGGACAYTFDAKEALFGLNVEELERLGAVREDVARALAEGARRVYGADVGLGTTGVAGPGADSHGNPEGDVYVACSTPAKTRVEWLKLRGTREEIRAQASEHTVGLALQCVEGEDGRSRGPQ